MRSSESVNWNWVRDCSSCCGSQDKPPLSFYKLSNTLISCPSITAHALTIALISLVIFTNPGRSMHPNCCFILTAYYSNCTTLPVTLSGATCSYHSRIPSFHWHWWVQVHWQHLSELIPSYRRQLPSILNITVFPLPVLSLMPKWRGVLRVHLQCFSCPTYQIRSNDSIFPRPLTLP